MASLNLNFGQALEALRAGKAVAREGWNGKGMWLALVYDSRIYLEGQHDRAIAMAPFIVMRTAPGPFVPWLASQTDVLAVDWVVR